MNKNTGFTLIEVLISVVILAGGLLGLAALQAASLKNNQSAYNRGLATQLAYNMADRIRANTAGSATYTTTLPSAATVKPNCLTTTGCSQTDMATNDLKEWDTDLKTLPGGEGRVCFDTTPNDGTAATVASSACNGTGVTYAIKIWWDDGGATKQLFAVSFQP
jgi:type IV pilus assembly protein PilV